MTDSNLLLVGVGLAALIAGLATLFTALRRHRVNHPKGVAMLIGGMMVTAFGLLLTGFAIAYTAAGPLDINAAETAR